MINIVLVLTSAIFVSCKNDMQEVNQFSRQNTLPTFSITNFETTYSDSGNVMLIIKSPQLTRYERATEKYDEYPHGLNVKFMNSDGTTSATLKCSYARYYIEKELWEAKSDVEVISVEKGEKINTELMYWDMKRELVYSNKFVRITTPDEILSGEGFESSQDFTEWKILKPTGIINIDDE